jgi:hypothetical protein
MPMDPLSSRSSTTGRPEFWVLEMSDIELEALSDNIFAGTWEDGRPKRWPTLQLRVRGRAFDVYCEDRTDVTLDGYGVPVACGRTATREDLRRGWMSATEPAVTG